MSVNETAFLFPDVWEVTLWREWGENLVFPLVCTKQYIFYQLKIPQSCPIVFWLNRMMLVIVQVKLHDIREHEAKVPAIRGKYASFTSCHIFSLQWKGISEFICIWSDSRFIWKGRKVVFFLSKIINAMAKPLMFTSQVHMKILLDMPNTVQKIGKLIQGQFLQVIISLPGEY